MVGPKPVKQFRSHSGNAAAKIGNKAAQRSASPPRVVVTTFLHGIIYDLRLKFFGPTKGDGARPLHYVEYSKYFPEWHKRESSWLNRDSDTGRLEPAQIHDLYQALIGNRHSDAKVFAGQIKKAFPKLAIKDREPALKPGMFSTVTTVDSKVADQASVRLARQAELAQKPTENEPVQLPERKVRVNRGFVSPGRLNNWNR